MNGIGRSGVWWPMRRLIVLVAVLGLLTACDIADPQETGSILIVAMAGPTCPVETDPPDPECAPRPVASAPIVVSPADGRDVVIAQGATDAEGRLTVSVPVGDYIVTAGAVEGLMGTPTPVVVTVLAGLTTEVALGYDTGIR
jgi:hypothetical protein